MRGKLISFVITIAIALAGCSEPGPESLETQSSPADTDSPAPETTESASATPVPQASTVRPEWNDLEPDRTRAIAFNQTLQYLRDIEPIGDPINHLFSPNADRELAAKTLEKMPKIAGLFAETAVPSDFTVVWIDDADVGNASGFVCDEIGRCDIDPNRDVCSMGVLPGIVFFCYSSEQDPNFLVSVMSHDYAHFVQYEVSGTSFMPSWFAEGTATYFEKILEAERFSYDVGTLDQGLVWGVDILYESLAPLTFSNPPTEEEVVRAMKSSMVFGDLAFEQARLGYYLGTLTTEVMIAKEGLPKFFEFCRLTAEMEFVDAFTEVYGISMGEFFDYFAPYAVAKILSDGKR